MTTAISDDPVVTDPHRNLTPHQREALQAVDFFRHQRRTGGYWCLGSKRFATATIRRLVELGLVRQSTGGLSPTTRGHLVITKLKGRGI